MGVRKERRKNKSRVTCGFLAHDLEITMHLLYRSANAAANALYFF